MDGRSEVRRGPWKLQFDALARGQLYNLDADPAELQNLSDHPSAADAQRKLMADLLTWMMRTADPLPLPRNRYRIKRDPRNYWSPHST